MDYKKISILTLEIVELKKEIISFSNKYKLFSMDVFLPGQEQFIPYIVQQSLLIKLKNKEESLQNLFKKK